MLAEHPKTLFVGQSVAYDGQAAFNSFSGVPMEKRIEMPVAEDFQMGFCIGLALEGYIPVCFFPRIDFMLLAANQLVNHLDKLPLMSGYNPRIIIRTAIGSTEPLNPGPQHTQDHSFHFGIMCKNIDTRRIIHPSAALYEYVMALVSDKSSLVIEYMDKYHE